jgi:hypothetical protein
MFGLVKMSVLSAVLSLGVVTAFNPPSLWAQAAPAAKPFQGRIAASDAAAPLRSAQEQQPTRDFISQSPVRRAKGDRLKSLPGHCAAQTWPYFSSDCISGADERPSRQVRVITIESREGANTSVLTRIPQTVAQR